MYRCCVSAVMSVISVVLILIPQFSHACSLDCVNEFDKVCDYNAF